MAGKIGIEEERMRAALDQFGWTLGDEFWRRYYSDAWVFNLANAAQRLHERVEYLEREVRLRERQI